MTNNSTAGKYTSKITMFVFATHLYSPGPVIVTLTTPNTPPPPPKKKKKKERLLNQWKQFTGTRKTFWNTSFPEQRLVIEPTLDDQDTFQV